MELKLIFDLTIFSVNPESYKVTVKSGGDSQEELLTCPPAKRIALAQRYFLF